MKKSNKIFSVISGILFIILGIIFLLNPQTTILSLTVAIGIFLLISGVVSLVFYFREGKYYLGSSEILITGILDILCSFVFMINTGVTSVVLLTFLGAFMMIKGLSTFAFSFDIKKMGLKYWYLALIFGLINIILGIWGIFNINVGATIITLLFGFGFIITGISYFIILIENNKIEKYIKDEFGEDFFNNF